MNRNGLEKICNQATNFWKQQFIPSPKQDQDVSTNVGSNILEEQSIFEISAKKTEQYLFPDIERYHLNIEKCEQQFPQDLLQQPQQFELEDNYEAEASCSQCSDCQSKRKDKKKLKPRSCKSTKQRFTISQEAFILEQTRKGTSFTDIAQQIPGSTVNQVKHHLLKKLKICSKNTDLQGDNIAEIILKIQQLQQNENIDNAVKIQELRQHISFIENHLHHTKQMILQKYMILFQQQ
ncbi:unnamed protein product [Paramecium primaurelia]|uniref:HTH myb-type domain-containing protein n=1 Tax=Paramecium primaurelia TaxID=5886 RepID=A0A8S1NV63_PARPR|nr:unnamed protein product [Paramecium primaurelia]